jgi:hypothetical protein
LRFERVDIRFRSATTASPLKELLAYSLVLVYQDKLTEEVPDAIKDMLGIDIPENYETFVTVLVLVIAIYGVSRAFELMKAKKGAAPPADSAPSIQGNYNTVVHVAGDLIGMDPADITATLDRRYAGAKAKPLARKALEFIRPAKREDGAAVEGGGVAIDPDTVRAAPSSFEPADEDDDATPDTYVEQAVVIHATDLDSNKSGWAGHLPGIWEQRLKMRLYPTINPADIYGRHEIVADVILVMKRDANGDLVPDLFHVVRIY